MNSDNGKPKKIFISHATLDKEYVSLIVSFLQNALWVESSSIYCSSLPGYGVPVTDDFVLDIKKQFQEYELFVLFIISDSFNNSSVCMNEMGATWSLDFDYGGLILPGFGYDIVRGVISKNKIAIRFSEPDENTTRFRLKELAQRIGTWLNRSIADEVTIGRAADSLLEQMSAVELQKLEEQKQEKCSHRKDAQGQANLKRKQADTKKVGTTQNKQKNSVAQTHQGNSSLIAQDGSMDMLLILARMPEQFTAAELARASGYSVRTIQKMLRNYLAHGLISSNQRGKKHTYSLNYKEINTEAPGTLGVTGTLGISKVVEEVVEKGGGLERNAEEGLETSIEKSIDTESRYFFGLFDNTILGDSVYGYKGKLLRKGKWNGKRNIIDGTPSRESSDMISGIEYDWIIKREAGSLVWNEKDQDYDSDDFEYSKWIPFWDADYQFNWLEPQLESEGLSDYYVADIKVEGDIEQLFHIRPLETYMSEHYPKKLAELKEFGPEE